MLALVLAGGVGYLWYAGKLPGVDAPGAKAGPAAGQKRDVIVVHLRPTNDAPSSTLLLVDNASTEKGNTLLLPNSLALASEDGDPTTLGKAVEEDSAAPTRDSLSQLLGAKIKGTWRLDTPYLENLVESVGGVTLTADVTVPGDKKGDRPLVKKGANQDLDGRAAVAYSTHRAEGERQSAQLDRWGQVMQAVFKKFTSDAKSATRTVEALGQVPDPSLDQSQLGASLASLAAHAKSGDYRTQLLPVQGNGTLSERTGDGVVKEVLGGTVKNTDPDAAPTIRVRNSSGDSKADEAAQVALVNGGFSVTDGGRGKGVQARSQVLYSKKDQADRAKEIARTLDLPDGSVKRSTDAGSADVLVVLGRDYEG
ncbi:LCP family protein [Streptomyces sp. NPDC005438]|uniref:LCP family protein n=1 Tax=Streptomyces sp. NPDC005438 TaxID=3156880 RepID=UPI0033BDE1A7